MSRAGGVYSLPAAYQVADGDDVLPIQHNTPLEDIEADLNEARPISSGGTGATTVSEARDNFAISEKVLSKAANYTVAVADRSKLINCTDAITVSLPAAATAGDGFTVKVFASAGTVTIDPDGSETVNGETTISVTNANPAYLVCDGTSWYAIGTTMGADSGLDADLLDGIEAAKFLRSDEDDTTTANLTIEGNLSVDGTSTVTGDSTFEGDLTVEGDEFIEGQLTTSSPTDLQVSVGSDTGGTLSPYVGFYDGQSTRRGIVQANSSDMRLSFDSGADLRVGNSSGDIQVNSHHIKHTGRDARLVGGEILCQNDSGAALNYEDTTSGANLHAVRFTSAGAAVITGATLSGTWQAKGYADDTQINWFARIS